MLNNKRKCLYTIIYFYKFCFSRINVCISPLNDCYCSTILSQKYTLNPQQRRHLTNQDRMVTENTRLRVKIKSELTNFKIKSRIEGYNSK